MFAWRHNTTFHEAYVNILLNVISLYNLQRAQTMVMPLRCQYKKKYIHKQTTHSSQHIRKCIENYVNSPLIHYMAYRKRIRISSWVPMCFLWLSPESFKCLEKYKKEYACQILDGNNIEPPISENHSRVQIITSFAYCMHIIIFFKFCNTMH